jgi:hypothetical protein
MSSVNRLVFACAALIVLLIAVLLFKPVDESPSPSSTSATPESQASDESTPGEAAPKPNVAAATPRPKPLAVQVRDLQPAGGIKELEVRQGERVRFTVASDQAEEVHLHGYDISREVGPGTLATYSFPATITGIFEVELEHAGVEILKLTVRP